MTPDTSDETARRICAVLQYHRTQAEMSLDDLATDASVSAPSLSLYLRGRRAMPMSVFFRVCAALEVAPADVVNSAMDSSR